MSDHLESALDAEIAALEVDIRERPDPRVIRLHKLKQFRDEMYPTSVSPSLNLLQMTKAITGEGGAAKRIGADGIQNSPLSPQIGPGLGRNAGRKRSTETQIVLDAAARFLQGRMIPTKTAEIYDRLQELGIVVPGNDPKSNLAAMLSNADELFRSHGRAGWTLTSQQVSIIR